MRGLESRDNFDYWVNMGFLMMVLMHKNFRNFMVRIMMWLKMMKNFIMVRSIRMVYHVMRSLKVMYSKVMMLSLMMSCIINWLWLNEM